MPENDGKLFETLRAAADTNPYSGPTAPPLSAVVETTNPPSTWGPGEQVSEQLAVVGNLSIRLGSLRHRVWLFI